MLRRLTWCQVAVSHQTQNILNQLVAFYLVQGGAFQGISSFFVGYFPLRGRVAAAALPWTASAGPELRLRHGHATGRSNVPVRVSFFGAAGGRFFFFWGGKGGVSPNSQGLKQESLSSCRFFSGSAGVVFFGRLPTGKFAHGAVEVGGAPRRTQKLGVLQKGGSTQMFGGGEVPGSM